MRLTLILLFTGTLATIAADSYAQQAKLSFNLNNVSIEQVLGEIENNSDFYFLYNNKLVDVSREVSVSFDNENIEQILDYLFADKNVKYQIVDRQIIISPIEYDMLNDKGLQTNIVNGEITDEDGLPLPGVNIILKGTTKGTISANDGTYALEVSDLNKDVLVFSFIGFLAQEVEVNGKRIINVTLEQDISRIDEVVVVGYGTQKKVNVTGSVASVSTEQISNRPMPKMGEVLRGVSPNLNVSLSSAGGEPGASSNWNIRGIGSLSGNASPLILVDGVEMNINNIDPANVESISVLKDASASAIYGARAPFGVILITTKKGEKDGGISIQYNNNFAIGTSIGVGHLESSIVYATVINQTSANSGKAPVYDDDYLARIQGYLDGTYTTEYDPENPPVNIWGGRRVGNANYDWPHEWIKSTKLDQKHSINVSGGNEKFQFYTSLGYFDQDGFLRHGYDDYSRYDFLVNLQSKVTDWLSFNISSKFANSRTDYPHGITTVTKEYIWYSIYGWSPITPKYNLSGNISNPWIRSEQSSGRIKTKTNDALFTAGAELEPVKGWKTNISYTYNLTQTYMESNPKPVLVEYHTGKYGNVGKPNATYSSSISHSPYSLFNAVTSYEKKFNDHFLKILVGYEQEEKFYSALNGGGGILISENVPSISTSLGTPTVDDTKWDWSTQGVFGRLNYNYKEKYLLELSARYNGSSKFDPESRWGFFPSGSIGYQISKENFWSTIEPYVNMMKIRASYGALGNQNVANYLYIPNVPVYSQTPWIISGERPPYAATPSLISESLTWETVTTTNLGIDAGFLDNRLELNFDWFSRKTTDMFGPSVTLPYTLGTSTPKANNASLKTTGFELVLSWENRISNDFSYDVQLSLGDAKSTILEYINEREFITDWYKGKDVGEIWGFITDGLIQTEGEAMPDQSSIFSRWGPGDMKYKDLTGDGAITTGNRTLNDHGDLTVIGNSTPRYNLGISGGINWKGFDFSMQWFGYLKRDYLPSLRNELFQGIHTSYLSVGLVKGSKTLDYWRPENETNMLGPNTDAYFAKPYFSSETNKNRQAQSKYVLNGGFMRLKYVQLGYTIPEKLSKKVFVKNARIYISGENLLSIDNLPKAIDPESSLSPPTATWSNNSELPTGGFYPMARTFSIGMNVTF